MDRVRAVTSTDLWSVFVWNFSICEKIHISNSIRCMTTCIILYYWHYICVLHISVHLCSWKTSRKGELDCKHPPDTPAWVSA